MTLFLLVVLTLAIFVVRRRAQTRRAVFAQDTGVHFRVPFSAGDVAHIDRVSSSCRVIAYDWDTARIELDVLEGTSALHLMDQTNRVLHVEALPPTARTYTIPAPRDEDACLAAVALLETWCDGQVPLQIVDRTIPEDETARPEGTWVTDGDHCLRFF